jgi:SAM-dependent methyltransferase
MIEQARRLNPDISFREGNMIALSLEDGTLAGIVAFYAIVNIPKESLPLVFQEMERVLQPGGLLLLAFHIGDEVLHEKELWGRPIWMDFFLFQSLAIRRHIEAVGLAIEEIIEREPYAPEVEYQSRRAYIFARKPDSHKASLPSSQAALRPPGPLRTGRESFPSPSSSPSNASLEETRFRNGKTLTMNPVMALGMK